MARLEGLEPPTHGLEVREANVSTGRNSATLDKVPKGMLPGIFDYGAKLSTMVKDIVLVLGLMKAEQGAARVSLTVRRHVVVPDSVDGCPDAGVGRRGVGPDTLA